MRILFRILLPLYGILFTLIFFSIGVNNYNYPDMSQKMLC